MTNPEDDGVLMSQFDYSRLELNQMRFYGINPDSLTAREQLGAQLAKYKANKPTLDASKEKRREEQRLRVMAKRQAAKDLAAERLNSQYELGIDLGTHYRASGVLGEYDVVTSEVEGIRHRTHTRHHHYAGGDQYLRGHEPHDLVPSGYEGEIPLTQPQYDLRGVNVDERSKVMKPTYDDNDQLRRLDAELLVYPVDPVWLEGPKGSLGTSGASTGSLAQGIQGLSSFFSSVKK